MKAEKRKSSTTSEINEHVSELSVQSKRIGYVFIFFVAATSFLNITGWIYDIPLLRGERQGWTTMKPATSLCFVLASVSLMLLHKETISKSRQIFIKLSGIVLIIAGGFTLFEYIAVMSTGRESSISTLHVFRLILQNNLRMALITSLLFILIGVILLILSLHYKRAYGFVHLLALLILLVNYIVPMSYVTGVTSIYLVDNVPVALTTGINFILFGSSILLFYPDTWLMKVFLERYAGGNMARRLIPGIVIIPIVISWLRLKGEQRGFFSSETGIMLAGVTYTFCFLFLVWITAKRVINIDKLQRSLTSELRDITDNSPDVIARFDLSLKHTFINPYGEKVYGRSRSEIIGKTSDDLGMPEDKTAFWKKNFEEVIATGNQINLEFEFDSPAFGHQHFHSVYVPEKDSDGKIVSILAITRDITRLREIEEKFKTLFENISEGVAIHEIVYNGNMPVNYRLLDVNPAYTKNSGIERNKAVGSLATELYGTPDPPFFNIYLEVATTGKPHRFETYFEQLDRHFMIDAVSPKKGQFATVFEDITDQKKTELEIKKKNEELTRFIYTVSHDLKSPLVTIKSFISYLIEDIESKDKHSQEKDIRYIVNAADKMGNLLNELLGLSRIGRKEEPKTEIPMKVVVQSAIDLVAGRIANSGAKVIITGPDIILYGHQQRLLQLYQNLIDNAIKFMGDQPEPMVEIGSTPDPLHKQTVLFVRDNGSGIDPRYHDKVFGLFEKLDNRTEGTGIGLALIKRIVEVHNGTVWFISEGEGKGTTFYFTLEKTREAG